MTGFVESHNENLVAKENAKKQVARTTLTQMKIAYEITKTSKYREWVVIVQVVRFVMLSVTVATAAG